MLHFSPQCLQVTKDDVSAKNTNTLLESNVYSDWDSRIPTALPVDLFAIVANSEMPLTAAAEETDRTAVQGYKSFLHAVALRD